MYLFLKAKEEDGATEYVGLLPACIRTVDVLREHINIALEVKAREPLFKDAVFSTWELEPQLWLLVDSLREHCSGCVGICDRHPSFSAALTSFGNTIFKEDRLVVRPETGGGTRIRWQAVVSGTRIATPMIFMDQLEDVAKEILGPCQQAAGRLGHQVFGT